MPLQIEEIKKQIVTIKTETEINMKDLTLCIEERDRQIEAAERQLLVARANAIFSATNAGMIYPDAIHIHTPTHASYSH